MQSSSASPASGISLVPVAPATDPRLPRRVWLWAAIVLTAALAALLYQHFDLGRLLTLEQLKLSRDGLMSLYQSQPQVAVLSFFGLYVVATALSFLAPWC